MKFQLVVVHLVEPYFTDAARKAGIQGACYIQPLVNTKGIPESRRLIKRVDPDLDQQAIKAAMKYRFKPAMRAGEPVPVMIAVQVAFRLRNDHRSPAATHDPRPSLIPSDSLETDANPV